MRPESVYALVRRLRRRLGDAVPAEVTPHWFRHTHATALLLAGVPEHVVMRRLGHADIQTTIDLYGWVTEDAELRAVAGWRGFCEGWRVERWMIVSRRRRAASRPRRPRRSPRRFRPRLSSRRG